MEYCQTCGSTIVTVLASVNVNTQKVHGQLACAHGEYWCHGCESECDVADTPPNPLLELIKTLKAEGITARYEEIIAECFLVVSFPHYHAMIYATPEGEADYDLSLWHGCGSEAIDSAIGINADRGAVARKSANSDLAIVEILQAWKSITTVTDDVLQRLLKG